MLIYWLKHRSTHFPVHEAECLIGRGSHCALIVTSPRASREHAIVRQTEEGLEVVDLQSRNGTLVNGKPVNGRCTLVYGDVIQVGDETIDVSSQLETQVIRRGAEPCPPRVCPRNVLKLAEELILRGTEKSEKQATAQVIYSMVEALMQNADAVRYQLSPGEAVRLCAVAQVVARWSRDAQLETWCQHVEHNLCAQPEARSV